MRKEDILTDTCCNDHQYQCGDFRLIPRSPSETCVFRTFGNHITKGEARKYVLDGKYHLLVPMAVLSLKELMSKVPFNALIKIMSTENWEKQLRKVQALK